jgi:hypothetical protein
LYCLSFGVQFLITLLVSSNISSSSTFILSNGWKAK